MHLLPITIRQRVVDRAKHFTAVVEGDLEKRGDGRSCKRHTHLHSLGGHLHLHRCHGPAGDCVDHAAHRTLPIFSGILIPFSIMLSIPSLTGHWYVRTGEDHSLLQVKPNPPLLDIAMAFSMACGILANLCLVVRFSERRIKLMTVMCIAFLSLHDIINIPAVTIFGVIHRFDDGFTYGQSFWLTVCSTIFSTATNITLIFDYSRTKDFAHSGSGLTPKQRSLLIIIIVLLCYISLGSALLAITLNITFLDGLYLSVVSIETIGFGDLHPTSTGTRVLACVYISGGILNLALLVALSREALLEAAAEGVQARMRAARAHVRERNIRTRWRAAVHWRLKAQRQPTWVDDLDEEFQGRIARSRQRHWYSRPRQVWRRLLGETWREWEDPAWKYVYGPGHKRLNLEALSEAELETAALEAGLPLSELIPKGLNLQGGGEDDSEPLSRSWRHPFLGKEDKAGRHPVSLTHVRMGGMASLLSNFALAVTHGSGGIGGHSHDTEGGEGTAVDENSRSHGIPFTRTLTTMTFLDDDEGIYVPESLETVEKNAFYTRLSLSLSLFFIFWMAGSAIFMKTEDWGFGSAMYFCFVSFSTVGYGDLSPRTPAGRSIFIVWALLGVGTMTILISILAEAYSSSYKNVIKSESTSAVAEMFSGSTQPVATLSHPLNTRAMSLPPTPGKVPSSGSTTVGDTWTPAASPLLTRQSPPHPARARRATLMITVPESPHLRASDVVSKYASDLDALPMRVVRHVDHLMSIIATRKRSTFDFESGGMNELDIGNRSNVASRILADKQETEALLLEIEEHLAEIAKASKEALKEAKMSIKPFHI